MYMYVGTWTFTVRLVYTSHNWLKPFLPLSVSLTNLSIWQCGPPQNVHEPNLLHSRFYQFYLSFKGCPHQIRLFDKGHKYSLLSASFEFSNIFRTRQCRGLLAQFLNQIVVPVFWRLAVSRTRLPGGGGGGEPLSDLFGAVVLLVVGSILGVYSGQFGGVVHYGCGFDSWSLVE
jgi:hypothetical protein